MFFCVSGDVITRRHTVEMSEQYRDQLAKAIYGRLFSHLVNSSNDYLQGQDDSIGYNCVSVGVSMCVCVCAPQGFFMIQINISLEAWAVDNCYQKHF